MTRLTITDVCDFSSVKLAVTMAMSVERQLQSCDSVDRYIHDFGSVKLAVEMALCDCTSGDNYGHVTMLTIADYRDLGSVELAIKDGALSKLECLRLNENIITR